jgi:dihydroorotase
MPLANQAQQPQEGMRTVDRSNSPTRDEPFDCVLTNCRVIDPANKIDSRLDVAILAGRIVGVDRGLASKRRRKVIDLNGAIVTPGLVDVHVHVYEWVTNFGVPPDSAGIHSGATTIVDQGSSGAWTFGGFKAFIADPARTDVRAFLSINAAGALKGGMEGPALHNPDLARVDELVELVAANPRLIKGIKCHGESGAMSHWETKVLNAAAEAGRAADIPLYVHTGELFPVVEARRPIPETVLPTVLPLLKPGDMIAHIYSCMPDGVVGKSSGVPEAVLEARSRGIFFDLGHGVNLSFRIARMMMEAGILPDTLGSDVHGDFTRYHDFSTLNYSLLGGINKMIALGMSLVDAIACVTANTARFLRDSTIGALSVGNPADITVLETLDGAWSYVDAEGDRIVANSRLVPRLVFKDGEEIRPDCGLLSDLLPGEIRPFGISRPARLRQAGRPSP